MKIVESEAFILDYPDDILRKIEVYGRVCYKSEEKMTEDSAEQFVKSLIARGHLSVLEHINITAKLITDRGVTHELVRHRLAAYSQESTRYCNYSADKFNGELTVIAPSWCEPNTVPYNIWKASCEEAEDNYFDLLENGAVAQQARSLLPHSVKTEIVMTANLREWLHIFELRRSPAAHPDMRDVMEKLYKQFHRLLPEVFA